MSEHGEAAKTICNYCGLADVEVRVVVPADLSHTGRCYTKVVPIDACIADIVRRLNAGAITAVTRGSCCGHGKGGAEIQLADGRLLQVSRTS